MTWNPPRSTPADVEVLNWPLVQDGWRSVIYFLLTVGFTSTLFYLSGSPTSAALGCLAISISMWRFWLPVRFQLSPLGVVQICLGRQRFIPWRHIKRHETLRSGVMLFFSTERSPLSLLSTLYIGWREQRTAFLQLINNSTNGERGSGRSISEQSSSDRQMH